MKTTNILLIFALFLFANATGKFEFGNFAEVAEVSQTSYGKSLIETINLSLQKGGDVSTVQKLLDDLLFKLNKDQEDADKAWVTENARLQAKMAKLNKEIKALQKEIRKLRSERKRYLALIVRVNSNIVQYKAQLKADRVQIVSLTDKRGKDEDDFTKSQEEHMDIINAITTVVKDLTGLVGSISGEGKPADVKAISEEKRDALASSFMQITKDDEEVLDFIQMATEADQDSLKVLIGLLNRLKQSTQKSFNADKAAESKSKKTYDSLVAILNRDIEKLDDLLVGANKNLKNYLKKEKGLLTEINTNVRLMNNKNSERKATKKEHKAKLALYNQEKLDRSEEVKVVTKLQKMVKDKLANMSKYLSSATGA